jgi:hypothetical protein
MRLNLSFSGLDRLRLRMGAPLQHWEAHIGLSRLKDIIYEPHEREIENLSDLDVGLGDTIVHGGHRVFLYIREFRVNAETFEEASAAPDDLRKFHIVWCKKLNEMKAAGKFDKYVVSDRVDEPFGVALQTSSGDWACGDAELYVCRWCLQHSNWESYRGQSPKARTDIVSMFSRRRFLETSHTAFAELPTRSEKSAPALGYAKDWAERSLHYRASKQFKCEDCGVDCSKKPSLLDTHHNNGVTTDNRISNLRALCKICHSLKHRGWYKVSSSDVRAIEAMRLSQKRRPDIATVSP